MKKFPVGTKLAYDQEQFFQQYKSLAKDKPYHVILESGRGGRYCIAGLDPIAIVKGKGSTLHIQYMDGNKEEILGNPLDNMKVWMQQHEGEALEGYPSFNGGAIGYVSYDSVRYIENIPVLAEDDLHIPDLYFLLFDDVFIYDKELKVLNIIVQGNKGDTTILNERLTEYVSMWSENADSVSYPFEGQIQSAENINREVSFTEHSFVKAVEKVQNYISKGDVFQVNLSVRQAEALKTHPMEIYTELREVNPSPYMGYLQLPEFQLISASPELLVKREGTEISTRPIAGTRSRGKDEKEDMDLAKELIENEKERAEHVMLVDLERNDLGRVAEFGSVEVNEFMVIEKYSHVMHIVSNVRGTLQQGKDAFDLIKATFPGGTITGAPKIRTMEIIEELEPVRRSVYTGSLGWIGYNGDMELNITIRTMLAKDGRAYVQAGAGIVIDSVPEREYKESLKKAAALWRAKELSEQEKK
ncbi:anthranilate synthase component I family protein [Bacillus alkalisoli]|uniref:anthranilate synthase component I family protein n=1 Tax=Bacillus alkalisoli TaxID=2011008 RepID=UPI000C2430D7|nr:anthranilate synthase component I family protein [Bacillus alkalisoli]